jgi:hypothetical protein|tara:strand:+ start:510 stop:1088 length:579 start_codon:yes stop_codon:yes gene_type:complete
MKKILASFLLIIFFNTSAFSENNYVFGGIKIFNYGIETDDLQTLNQSMIDLGFSSSKSETDNTGVGFDVGMGIGLSDGISVEAGYINYGTLEIKTTLTGPAESLTTEISGDGVTVAGVLNLEGVYLKGGIHSWDFTGTVSTSKGSSSQALGTGTDPFFGIGFVSENLGYSFEHYIIDDGDISSVNLFYSMPF